MKTVWYRIIDENNGDVCMNVQAGFEKSALKKFRDTLLTTGIYEIVREKDGKLRLVSSYGSCFRAEKV